MQNNFNDRNVYTWENAELAKKYISKLGYFGNTLEELKENVNTSNYSILSRIRDSSNQARFTQIEGYCNSLFIPKDKVRKTTDKKFRKFNNLEELEETLGVDDALGAKISYYKKDSKDTHKSLITKISTVIRNNTEVCEISFGNEVHTFDDLFDNYGLIIDGIEQPFGYQEC